MTNKICSSIIFTTSIVFFFLARANPNNLLFLFASANLLVAVSRMILGAGMMLVSFRNLPFNKFLRQMAIYLGFALIIFGGLSLVITPLGSAEYNYAKLLDWMIFAEAGVTFALAALNTSLLPKASVAKSSKAKAAKLRSRAA